MIRAALLLLCLLGVTACGQSVPAEKPAEVPRGYYASLEIAHAGGTLSFGPFVGYYFKPVQPDDLTRLEFLCFNEQSFYTDEMPANALLFEGQAVLATLPAVQPVPLREQRINPVFFDEAPSAWLAARPQPQEKFLHFHSAYDRNGASYTGYWLKHEPVASFPYNMGGRVDQTSPLYHQAEPGRGDRFPLIIEFDYGPGDPSRQAG